MRMRSRLLAGAASLALAAGGLVLTTGSPASAHCSGHRTHPDRYHSGGISFGNGTAIRYEPHIGCDRAGLGYPRHRIDVHCAVHTGNDWLFVRDVSTGKKGWARWDTVRRSRTVRIPHCSINGLYLVLPPS